MSGHEKEFNGHAGAASSQRIVVFIFPIGNPDDEQDRMEFGSLRELKNFLKHHEAPDGMAYGLRNADLSGLKLKKLNLSNAWLENVKLSGARIAQANLTGATLRNVDLGCAEILQLNMRDGTARSCRFQEAKLPHSNFIRATIRDCDFTMAECQQAYFRGARIDRTIFDTTILNGAEMQDATIRGGVVCGAGMNGALLEDLRAYNVDMRHTDLSYAVLKNAQLICCDLRGVILSGEEEADGMALTGGYYDHDLVDLLQNKALFNPRVDAKRLARLGHKRPGPSSV